MKTEKRHAEVGESIVITTPNLTWGQYRKGDVLKVTQTAGEIPHTDQNLENGEVMVEGCTCYIDPDEYEVITEEDNHAETNEA